MDDNCKQTMLELAYGRMAMKVHQIERSLALIAAMKLSDNEEEYSNLFLKYKKLTLGRLVSLSKDKHFFDQELTQYLQNLLVIRNELIHDIGDLVADSIFTGGKPDDIIEHIARFNGFLAKVSVVLRHEMSFLLNKSGVDLSELTHVAVGVARKWRS